MTTSTAAVVGSWADAHDLVTAASWYGQHDGPVLLQDDTVLVAGGTDATASAIADAAVFTPGTGTGEWRSKDAMHSPRQLHTLTRLDNGDVLAVGGLNGSAGLRTAEVYHPDTGKWSTTGQLETARWGHSATLLADGSVLVTGGSTARSRGGTTALRSAERYDPEGGVWHTVAAMTDARTAHSAVLLSGGVVLVVGGVTPVGAADDPAIAFCELYAPARDDGPGTWTPTGTLLHARHHHRATRLSDRTVLVTGGTAPGSPGAAPFDPFSQRTVELYDLDTGQWSQRAEMPSGRAFHRAVAFGTGQVLVAGGSASDRDEAGYRSAFVYDVTGNEWTPAAGLAIGRFSFAATALADDRVLVAGGVVRSGLAAADPTAVELTRTTELFTDGSTP